MTVVELLESVAGSGGDRIAVGSRDGTGLTYPELFDRARAVAGFLVDRGAARLMVVEPMGSETLLTIDYREQRLVARVNASRTFDAGQVVWLNLPAHRSVWFDAAGRRIADDDATWGPGDVASVP